MTRDAVEYLYGDTNQGRLQVFDDYFPKGTKYRGVPLFVMTYRLHGGILRVKYVHDRAKVIETTSRYYRTPRGIGVGTRIPLGPCHRSRFGSCEYRWRSLQGEALLEAERTVRVPLGQGAAPVGDAVRTLYGR
jgi:hypothetical protein